jgi:hypothetical protein
MRDLCVCTTHLAPNGWHAESTACHPAREKGVPLDTTSTRVRAVVFVVAVAGALVAVFATRPDADARRLVAEALVDAELNNDRAEGAPQQQVVNGWAARDLLAIQAAQIDETNTALWGLSWLLAIAVALVGWQTFASRRPSDAVATDAARSAEPLRGESSAES